MMEEFELELQSIADHYGFDGQIEKLEEELIELLHATRVLRKHRAKNEISEQDRKNFVDEMADVSIMMYQIVYLTIIESDVKYRIKEKLDRQIERIRREAEEKRVHADACGRYLAEYIIREASNEKDRMEND